MGTGLEVRSHDGWTLVSLSGEVDLATAPALEAAIDATDEGSQRVAVDLSRVTFMDSSSFGALVNAKARLEDRGGTMVIVGVHGSPAKVMKLSGLDAVFDVVADLTSLPPS
jgi:anti-sigma B factor antagonist